MKRLITSGIIRDGSRASTAGTCKNTRKIARKIAQKKQK